MFYFLKLINGRFTPLVSTMPVWSVTPAQAFVCSGGAPKGVTDQTAIIVNECV
jgi:hypothetical protein